MFLVEPVHFWALKAQLVVLVSAFVMVSTVLVSFLFAVLLLTVPPRVQPFVKVAGGRATVLHGVGAMHCWYTLTQIQSHLRPSQFPA